MSALGELAVAVVHHAGRLRRDGLDDADNLPYLLHGQRAARVIAAGALNERGGGPEPEDDESRMWSWAKWTTQRVVLSPLSTVPLVREIGSAIDNNFKFGVKFTPAQGGLDALARLLNIAIRQGGNALSGEDIEWGDIAEGAATVAGYRYGVPNRKMIQAAKAFEPQDDPGGEGLLGVVRRGRGHTVGLSGARKRLQAEG